MTVDAFHQFYIHLLLPVLQSRSILLEFVQRKTFSQSTNAVQSKILYPRHLIYDVDVVCYV